MAKWGQIIVIIIACIVTIIIKVLAIRVHTPTIPMSCTAVARSIPAAAGIAFAAGTAAPCHTSGMILPLLQVVDKPSQCP